MTEESITKIELPNKISLLSLFSFLTCVTFLHFEFMSKFLKIAPQSIKDDIRDPPRMMANRLIKVTQL